MTSHRSHSRFSGASAVVGALAFAVSMAACGSDAATTSNTDAAVPSIDVVATKQPESQLLAEIYAQVLEVSGVRVGRKDPVADRAAAYQKLTDGQAQLTPEFTQELLEYLGVDTSTIAAATTTTVTSTTVTSVTSTGGAGSTTTTTGLLDAVTTTSAPAPVDPQVQALNDALPGALVIGDPSPASANGVIVCTAAAVEKYTLSSIADLAKVSDTVTVAGPTGFDKAAPWGMAGLAKAYGGAFSAFVPVTDGDVAAALRAGTADCGVLRATAPEIVLDGLLELADGKAVAPANRVLPLLTAAGATTGVLDALAKVGPGLTTDVVRALLVKAGQDGSSYYLVAKQYLESLSGSQQG